MSKYNMHGGVFSPLGYSKINEGGSHESNPNGGVQLGVDPNGIPNMVEEGETVYDDFVYSDNIYADGGMLEKHNLPKKWGGLLYSEVADKILADVDDMTTDEIALRGMKVHLQRLAEAQEEQKEADEQRQLEEELANLSPEEMMALQQELANQGVPEEQIVAACGGKLHHKFAAGGPMTADQIDAWRTYMTLMNSYADDALAGKLVKNAGKKSIKELEDSAEYKAFTNYVLDNPSDPMVNVYLLALNEQASTKNKLFGDNGKLKRNWRDTFYKNRNDGADGIFHYSGTDVASLGIIGRGGYSYAPVDNGAVDTAALSGKYAENPRGRSTTGRTVQAPSKSPKATESTTRRSTTSARPGITRQPDITSDAVAGLMPTPPPVAPQLGEPEITDSDLEVEGIDPRLLNTRAEELAIGRTILNSLGRNRYNNITSAIQNPYAVQPAGVNLSDYTDTPSDENIAESVPRYRMPEINPGGVNTSYVPESLFSSVVNPYRQNPGYVNLTRYRNGYDDENIEEEVPRYREPAAGQSGIAPNVKLIANGFRPTQLAELDFSAPASVEEQPVNTNIGVNGQQGGYNPDIELIGADGFKGGADLSLDFSAPAATQPGNGLPGRFVANIDPMYSFNHRFSAPLPFYTPYQNEEEQKAEPVYGTRGQQGGYEITIPPMYDFKGGADTTLNFVRPAENQTTPTGNSGGNNKKVAPAEHVDWRRYADAARNAAMGIFNLFQTPDELNVPTARSRFVNTPIPEFINPVYRPTDPNLVTGDVLATGAGAARAIRGSGNPITASANLVALDNSLVSGLGKARAKVDTANNTRLNEVIAAKNSNILNRANAMYQQAKDRANYLTALDQYNIKNNLAAQQYKHAGEAAWAQAVSQPFNAVTKFLQDDYLEERRRNAANASSTFGYWMDDMLNRWYDAKQQEEASSEKKRKAYGGIIRKFETGGLLDVDDVDWNNISFCNGGKITRKK